MNNPNQSSPRFSWQPFYNELARLLVPYAQRQQELVNFLDGLRSKGLTITALEDKDEAGQRFLLREIDPFTFFGVFNRGTTNENRTSILREVKRFFEVRADLPADFSGIPLFNNMSSWLFRYAKERRPDDIPTLWRLFERVLDDDPLSDKEFAREFDKALDVKGVNVNLTMGLFWIRPEVFLSLDKVIRDFTSVKLPPAGLSFDGYLSIVHDVRRRFPLSFPELSHKAWLSSQAPEPPRPPNTPSSHRDIDQLIDYWLVGAYWDDQEPRDRTESFVKEGIWKNGYHDKFLDLVRQMKVGDRIAIKASSTQREGLPFDARGHTVSRNIIKAIGTITGNHGDGRTVDVEWDPLPSEPRNWYFYTGRATVWRLRKDNELARQLIRFVFSSEGQDYAYFIHKWWDEGAATEPEADADTGVGAVDSGVPEIAPPYSVDTAMAEGVFLTRDELLTVLDRLQAKRNVILEGPPGVGKTFVAEKIAFALMEAKDPRRITQVQFHPSFSYEDFVRGFRPTSVAGKFELVDGPFLNACAAATKQPDLRHVMIIDEINRGNTSQIFGDLLMLLETDKREMKPGISLLYPRFPDERFSIPSNLFVIGTMNTADRSLAVVDYALRRRFAFITLSPRFADQAFRKWLVERKMPADLVQRVIQRMNALNTAIESDRQLGRVYQVGHSFFCPRGDDFSALDLAWYRGIVETEIIPLLNEYWYGDQAKVEAASAALLAS